MTTKELYTKGARIWVSNPETVWEGAEVLEDYNGGTEIKVVLDRGGQLTLKVTPNTLPPLRNPEILIGENDLTSLSYLHEPAVLHNLQVRFCDLNAIYTYCGIVLVAINPYDELPIYGEETILAYRGQAMGDLDPHIFAVAEEAYTKLEREHKDQSIIVSGESGAGKTVSAKYAMRYFAAVGGSSSETQVERKVLASSPIMEAIGNAKTTRNDNSSRFGKFIEINLSRSFHIMGASMRTYLLEKSRVVFQAPGERNYHIFYQLCSVRDTMPHLMLTDSNDFHFLNQGKDPIIEGVDDSKMFQETKQALNTLGFTDSEQKDMFVVLAAILHFGNVHIFEGPVEEGKNDTSSETSQINPKDIHLQAFCKLCGVDPSRLIQKLTHRTLVSRSEVIESPLNCVGARGARDALAKHLYAQLFSWLVSGANRALRCSQQTHHRIGVLDIYGFETFEINSFEQFCINYANEKLQQQFNQHVFKLEQEEYLREDITWKMIEFHDNQPCIELIEARLGVLDLLDEECRVPQGSDAGWAIKLQQKCAHSPHYAAPRFQNEAFVIKHFADDVMYMTNGFLEKNRDTVLEDQVELLRTGGLGLLRDLCSITGPAQDTLGVPTPAARVKISPIKPTLNVNVMTKQHKQTVGAQFRASLTALMASLNSTTPHYVRCIKPNDSKKAFQYNPARAVQQLRACGVLETIRISAAGFPSRWVYAEFFLRYRVLCHSKAINRSDHKETCANIVHNCIKDEDKYKFGKTKIFFRAGQVAYLEKLRADRLRRCCIIMQSQLRAYVARKKYLRIKEAVAGIQRHARGYLARKLACELRRQRSAKTIQRHVRGWLQRVKYARLRRTAIGIQARARGLLARRKFRNVRRERAAIIIQKNVRGWLARIRCAKKRRRIVICQSAIRRFLARRQYKRLRAEARSVEHVKRLNRGLENKIISLQQRLGSLQVENKQIAHLQQEVADLKVKLEPMKSLEMQLKELKIALMERDNRIVDLDKQLLMERDISVGLADDRDKLIKAHKKEKQEWEYDSAKIAKELMSLKELTSVNQKDSEQKLREQYELEKRELISELDKEKRDYQRLLMDQYRLQAKLDELKEEKVSKNHHRSLSNASNASQHDGTDEDNGYSSVRSTQSSGIQLTLDSTDSEKDQGDAGLIIRLQRRVQRLTDEKEFLSKRVASLEGSSPKASAAGTRLEDQIRMEELEIENTRLLGDLNRLRSSVAMADGADISTRELAEQFVTLQEELERRREECVQLRGVLANQKPWFQALKDVSVNLKSLATSSYGNDADVSIINEDGELVQAFEAQKRITRQLEEEVKSEKERYTRSLSDYTNEIEKLREENEKQQKLLTTGLGTGNGDTHNEQFVQQEISRMASQNLALQEKIEELTAECEQYKRQVQMLTRKLKDLGVDDTADMSLLTSKDMSQSMRERDTSILPVVRKKEREDYMGMFEYKTGTETIIMQRLVWELLPRTAVILLPGLPAYVVFMCIRYTDHMNDEDKVRVLLKVFINGVKKVIRRRGEKMDISIMWLANTLRLLHCLKQYSGDSAYQDNNTPTQNEQCLRNFDLSEYRQVLSDIAVWIYQGLITVLEQHIQQLIIPALLEYEEISGVSGRAPRGRALSSSGTEPSTPGAATPSGVPRSPQHLTKELSYIRSTLHYFGVDPDLIVQIFRQLFYFVCATCLNQLLLRKDLCRWSKGMQIRYNLSYLEVWAKENYNQQECTTILSTLNPIIQAVYLLQARKSSDDVQSTCDMCPDLTPMQICKILNLYTPAEDFEPKITSEFIKQIQVCLQERDKDKPHGDHNNLLMDSKYNFAVKFPFCPSTIMLEHIELPESLNLQSFLTKI